MSLFFNRSTKLSDLVPSRNGLSWRAKKMQRGDDLRVSGVWAAVRLRANLVSSMPVDAYRKAGGIQVEITKPNVLEAPGALHLGGPVARMDEWLYATQVDLDRFGNAFGIIVERNALGFPTRIDLVSAEQVTVRVRNGAVSYKIGNEIFDPFQIWHERQYVVAGLPVGLSPVAFAAMTIDQYTSAQAFAQDWFSNGAIPSAKLRNTQRKVDPAQAENVKRRAKETLASGDVLVLGSDWDYEMIAVPPNQTQFLETQSSSLSDIARFFDVPGDTIDAAVQGSAITYANLVAKNLQLLIMHLGPAVQRREKSLSGMLPRPQFIKLASDALLRMDPETTAKVLGMQIDKRTTTVTEARALYNKPPLTPEEEAEFARLFPSKMSTPTKEGVTP